MSDDRLIVSLDVPNALEGLALAERLGDAVSFYKIGLGMLSSGGMALANELKDEHGKKIFMDLKLFDIGQTIEKGQPLCRVHASSQEDASQASARIAKAIRLGEDPVVVGPMVLERVGI